MKKKILFFSLLFIMLLLLPQYSQADKVGIKFSYLSNSISSGDINTWIDSYNSLWKDWQAQKGGQLTGQFEPIVYGPSYEFELRIPIFKGFALNFSGTYLKAVKEGQVEYSNPSSQQNETHFVKNNVTAIPFKIGFSMSIPLPVFPRLVFFAGGGRHIVFVRYQLQESYEAEFTWMGENFVYWFDRSDKLASEALGYYASAGIELNVLQFMSVVMEAERTWTKVDGFKGSHSYNNYLDQNEGGKSSLYYYESDQFNLGKSYPVLAGQRVRPDTSSFQNIRQGQLNFSGLSFKFGIRFKF